MDILCCCDPAFCRRVCPMAMVRVGHDRLSIHTASTGVMSK